jgi:hypothetical protein
VTARQAGSEGDGAGRPEQPYDLVAGLVREATIVATVELERVLRDLGWAEDAVRAAIAGAVPDLHLGAAVVLVDDATEGRLAFAEPTTEGRLAATLARHGEGPCGRYLGFPAPASPDALDAFRRRAAAGGVPISRVEDGPFGPSVLLLTGPVTGPHLIVAERRPVPSPP